MHQSVRTYIYSLRTSESNIFLKKFILPHVH